MAGNRYYLSVACPVPWEYSYYKEKMDRFYPRYNKYVRTNYITEYARNFANSIGVSSYSDTKVKPLPKFKTYRFHGHCFVYLRFHVGSKKQPAEPMVKLQLELLKRFGVVEDIVNCSVRYEVGQFDKSRGVNIDVFEDEPSFWNNEGLITYRE